MSPIASFVNHCYNCTLAKANASYCNTVKLGLCVHGLVRTLGYDVLPVDHGHRQSGNMYIFSDKTYRTWHKIGYYVQIFPPRALFAISLVLFSDHEHVVQPFSFDFNIPTRFQVHDALKGDFTVQKARNERHSRRRSIFRGRSFTRTRGTGPASEENRILDRTYFGENVPFFISLEGT